MTCTNPPANSRLQNELKKRGMLFLFCQNNWNLNIQILFITIHIHVCDYFSSFVGIVYENLINFTKLTTTEYSEMTVALDCYKPLYAQAIRASQLVSQARTFHAATCCSLLGLITAVAHPSPAPVTFLTRERCGCLTRSSVLPHSLERSGTGQAEALI